VQIANGILGWLLTTLQGVLRCCHIPARCKKFGIPNKENLPMKRFAMSVALLCALSVSALAVDVPTVGAPSPGQTQGGESVDPGNIPTGGFTVPGDMPGVGLSALLTILDLAF
jgi:hypothetical protein